MNQFGDARDSTRENLMDDENQIVLSISEVSTETTTLRAILTYMDVPHDVVVSAKEEMCLCVPEDCYDSGNELTEIRGFRAIFTTLARMAHLLPSDPIDAGVVTECIEFATNATYEDIEVKLSENQQIGKDWISPSFVESTAADFYLISRLTFERGEGRSDFDKFPLIAIYVDRDPATQTEEEEEEEGGESNSTLGKMCVVS